MSRSLPHFGPYEAVRRLGAGGMAETFVAVRRGPGGFEQKVCIKRILPAYADDRAFVESFLREARTSAALHHTNIVQVLDFGVADESYYLALELIDGLDLRALLVDEAEGGTGALPPEVVALIAGELSTALEHAHAGDVERGPIVHRDLSPSNVLVSRAGEVKLTDFGIARALGESHLTATGVIKGKVPYLPPEYIERGQFDERSDLFSLGVMLFELLCGKRPFDGESELDTIRRIVAGERPSIHSVNPPAPQPLAACIERLLALRPEERYPSARALLDHLPTTNVHLARRQLAALVCARLEALGRRMPTGPLPPPSTLALAQTVAEATPGTLAYAPPPAAHAPGFADEPVQDGLRPSRASAPELRARSTPTPDVTRTRAQRPARRAVSPRALVAAGAAALAFAALVLGFAVRSVLPEQGARSVPPPLPRALAAPEPEGNPRPSALANTEATGAASDERPGATPTDIDLRAAPPSSAAAHATAPAEPASTAAQQGDATEATHAAERARAPANLRVAVLPFGDVWVDGKPLGLAPISIRLPAGAHEVQVGDGRPEQSRTIHLRPGQHETLKFDRRGRTP